MTMENSQTMLAVLLVVGLVVGAGVGYFMAPGGDGNSRNWFDAGYDEGYDAGYIDGQVASAPWGSDPSDDFSSDNNKVLNEISGLATLIYGAIGASLIAALAAIVSLMQISRRISG